MSTTATSNPDQLRNLALTFAGVSFALASLFFLGDAITDWGRNLYNENSTGNAVILSFADFVGGVGMSTSTIPWLVGCTLVGVALLVTAIIKTKRSNKSASVA